MVFVSQSGSKHVLFTRTDFFLMDLEIILRNFIHGGNNSRWNSAACVRHGKKITSQSKVTEATKVIQRLLLNGITGCLLMFINLPKLWSRKTA